MTTVLKPNSHKSEILCVISDTSMRTFLELNVSSRGERENLANEKIRSRQYTVYNLGYGELHLK